LGNVDREIVSKFRLIIGDKGYDLEENHVIAKSLFTIIPARNEDEPIHLKRKTKRG